MPRRTRSLLLHLLAAVLLFLPAAFPSQHAWAFGLGVHAGIVNSALKGIMDDTGISIVRTSNVGSDVHQFAPEQHFDNAPNPGVLCDRWRNGIDTYLKSAVKSSAPEGDDLAKVKGRVDALEWFGRATHAIEDFYSHTNWLELTLATPGTPAIAPLNKDTCDLSRFPDLQSGFFALSLSNGASGCPKSGPPAPYIYCHLGLNKDELTSIEGKKMVGGISLHAQAVDRATIATTKLWLDAVHDRIVKTYDLKDYYADPECIFHKLAWDDKKSCLDLNGTWTIKTDAGTQVSFSLKQTGTALVAVNDHLTCSTGATRSYLFHADLTGASMRGALLLCWENPAVVVHCHVPEYTDNIITADLHRKGQVVTLSGSFVSRHWSWHGNDPCVESRPTVSFTMTRDAP
jgi:Heterokaryon incompatibility protein Het-C